MKVYFDFNDKVRKWRIEGRFASEEQVLDYVLRNYPPLENSEMDSSEVPIAWGLEPPRSSDLPAPQFCANQPARTSDAQARREQALQGAMDR